MRFRKHAWLTMSWWSSLMLISVILLVGGCAAPAPTPTPKATPAPTPVSSPPPKVAAKALHIDFSAVTDPPSPMYVVCEKFKEYAEKASSGRLDVTVYRLGQVGTSATLPDQVRTGSVQMMTSLSSYWTKWVPWFNVLDAPGIFKDYEQVWKAHDQWLLGEMGKEFDKLGLKPLGHCDVGFRWFLSKKVNIVSPDDFRGLKVRSMPSQLSMDSWVAWGAKPSPINYAECFSALEQGVIDGMDNSLIAVIGGKFYEVIKYVSGHNSVYSGNYPVINKAFFESLPLDLQDIVQASMKAAVDWARASHQIENNSNVALLRSRGLTVTVLTPQQIQKFVDATASVRQKASQDFGPQAKMVIDRLAAEK